MKRLKGKIAVVTGGGSGMGRATAKQFVTEGASVIITGRRQDRLDEAVAEIGGAIEGLRADIANLADLERLRAHIAKNYGHIDVIFADAGGGSLGAFGTISEADFDRTVATNLKGTFFTVQTLLPLIVDGGSIILNGLNCGRPRNARLHRVFSDQGCHTLVRPNVDEGSQCAAYPCKHVVTGNHLDSHHDRTSGLQR